MADTCEDREGLDISNSPCIALMFDESCDVAKKENMIIYVNFWKEGRPVTRLHKRASAT